MLKGWNKNVEGSYRKLKKDLMNQIDMLDKECETNGLDIAKSEYKIHLENQLNRILKEEEIKWFQKI